MCMPLYRRVRSKLFHSSKLLQYLWLRRTWKKQKQLFESTAEETFAKNYYREHVGQELNLNDPRTFDDKLWYLKLHNRDPLLTTCSDKCKVREYVAQCGLEHILNELYGVYDDARKIDFDALPSPCFLKCNHTSGDNLIFDRSKPFDKHDFIRRFNFMLKQNYYWGGLEWNYRDIPPRIIAEKVLRDKDGRLPLDYKFMCFHGVPKIMYLSKDTCGEDGRHTGSRQQLNYYDMDFNLLDISGAGLSHIDGAVERPATFERMREYAAILSKPFPFARVDFYSVDNQIYFGEITFYPTGGCQNLQPREWSLRLGSWIDLGGLKAEA